MKLCYHRRISLCLVIIVVLSMISCSARVIPNTTLSTDNLSNTFESTAAPDKRKEPQDSDSIEATENSGFIVEQKLVSEDSQIQTYYITYMSDGLKVKGYLVQPKAPGVYPAVIYNRGGNREFGKLTSASLQVYARMGFVTIGSQYRGNDGGEGKEQFGGDDIDDVMNLIPILKSMDNVNPDKIAMVGYSRGGMMTYLACKEQTLRGTNDIKAACTVGGVADLFINGESRTDMVRGVFIPLIGGTAQQLPEEFKARSATYWADQINVPLLIQHGEADWRVLPAESEKLSAELKKYGKKYKLITYPGDDHGLSAHNLGLYEIFSWLSKHLEVRVNLNQVAKTSTPNLSDTPPGIIEGNTFINQPKGYQISNLPSGWNTHIPSPPLDIIMSKTDEIWMGVGAFNGPAYTETFFNRVNAWWVPAITSKAGYTDIVITEDKEISFSGYRALKVIFEYTHNGVEYVETTYHIWRPKNDFCLYRIRLNCKKAQVENNTTIFEQFMDGFTFL